MARWAPGAVERLQQAALALFLAEGYENVTVARIAEHAGLTRRTFFNHFADKREVFFAGAVVMQADVLRHLEEAATDASPFDAAVGALTQAGSSVMAGYGQYAADVRKIIRSSAELQEREHMKMALLGDQIALALTRRNIDLREATIVAKLAMTSFTSAWEDCTNRPERSFHDAMALTVLDIRKAVTQASGGEAAALSLSAHS